jgi:hypothetical protein
MNTATISFTSSTLQADSDGTKVPQLGSITISSVAKIKYTFNCHESYRTEHIITQHYPFIKIHEDHHVRLFSTQFETKEKPASLEM